MIYMYVGVGWLVAAFVVAFLFCQITYEAMDKRARRRGR